MTSENRERLRSCTNKLIRLVTVDGEQMVVKVILMQDEYEDFICDIRSTNRAMKYKAPLDSSAYTIPYNDVESFTLVTELN